MTRNRLETTVLRVIGAAAGTAAVVYMEWIHVQQFQFLALGLLAVSIPVLVRWILRQRRGPKTSGGFAGLDGRQLRYAATAIVSYGVFVNFLLTQPVSHSASPFLVIAYLGTLAVWAIIRWGLRRSPMNGA